MGNHENAATVTVPVTETPLGATCSGTGCSFLIWAPFARAVEVHVLQPVTGSENAGILCVCRQIGEDEVLAAFNFEERCRTIECDASPGVWRRLLDSAATEWLGPGSEVPNEQRASKLRLELAAESFCLCGRTKEN